MADLATLYRQHAARAQAEADGAALENVRDRNLRAARAWEEMAERQERTERARLARLPQTDALIAVDAHDA